MTLFQLCFAPLCLLLACALIVRATRQAAFRWKGFLWAALWALGGVLVLSPNITTRTASLLGIGRGTDLVLYAGVLMGMYAFQRLYCRIRTLEHILTDVVRQQVIRKAFLENTPPCSSSIDAEVKSSS